MEIWKVNEETAEVLIYGTIDDNELWYDSSGASELAKSLKNVEDKNLNVRINSYGGSLFAGIAMMNILKNHRGKVTAYIDGIAASAASIVALGADEVIMPVNAMYMIHNPLQVTWGAYESKDLQKMAEVLDEIKTSLIAAYQTKTSLSKEEISKLMDEETWMTAETAKNLGFIDKVEGLINMSIKNGLLDMNGFNMPINSIPGQKQLLNHVQSINRDKNEDGGKGMEESNKLDKIINLLTGFLNPVNKEEEQKVDITKDLIASNHPDIYNQIKQEAVNEERARIKEIDNISKSIPAELVNKAKYDEPVTANELALNFMRDGGAVLNALKQDIENSGALKVNGIGTPEELTEDQEREILVNLMAKGVE